MYCEPVDGEVMSWLSEVAMRSSTLNGQHQTLGEMGHSNISKQCLPGEIQSNMSNMAHKMYSAPSNLKTKVWKRFGFSKEGRKLDKKQAAFRLSRTAFKYSSSTRN